MNKKEFIKCLYDYEKEQAHFTADFLSGIKRAIVLAEQLDEPSMEECEVEEVSENEKKYEEHTAEFLASLCRLKDRSFKIVRGGLEKAREVIDVIAKKVDLEDKGLWLYGLIDGKSRIADKMDEYFSRSGDKVKMKKRLDELENENNILRSLLGGATIKREKRDE